MTDHIRNEIAAWVEGADGYGYCPVSGTNLLAHIDAQAAEIRASDLAIEEYRQQCIDNAAEIARLRKNAERKPMPDADIDKTARQSGATAYTNRFVNGSAFSFGPDTLRNFVRAVEAFHGIKGNP